MVLLVAGFLLWVLCLTKLDLSYAYPVVCSSVLLVAFFSGLFLGETITVRTWCATALILAGLVLLGSGSR
jgi:drug/metabolite transporter (DMT)-like permease